MRKENTKTLFLAVSPGVVVLLLGILCHCLGYRINVSESMPLGVWKESDELLRRGSVVLACIPTNSTKQALSRGYVGRGTCSDGIEPLLKEIAAVPGDTVELSMDGVAINGRKVPGSRTLPSDSAGRPMNFVPRGTYHVEAGQFWLLSTHVPNSFDSRYFGPVGKSAIVHTVNPVFVF